MITEDYLMRQIEIIARTLAKLIFNKESTEYVIIDYQLFKETDVIHNQLLELIDDGDINKAENLLFEKIEAELEENPGGREYLEVAIDFYARLNELSTRFLDDCGFEREEIDEGLKEVSEIYGINII
ncbi:MAG: DUF6483 family protein [Oscillospiraceae bacterium]|nr:DUF6483 family protein [Oscillospiraceae bacterium]